MGAGALPDHRQGGCSAGFDLATERIPVGPAAHYIMGGVETDLWGRTTIPGLFAAGEVACTGVHGANRLASNSLLEGLVFGARAARSMVNPANAGETGSFTVRTAPDRPRKTKTSWPKSEGEVRTLMWRAVGLMREDASLGAAESQLESWYRALAPYVEKGGMDDARWRLASIVTVGWLIARAALRREETRGGHARSDFPARDDVNFRIHLSERKES